MIIRTFILERDSRVHHGHTDFGMDGRQVSGMVQLHISV